MMTTILNVIYFAGIASCGIQGAEKAMRIKFGMVRRFICAFLSAFAGGLIRDIIILHVYPAALTATCIPDIITALIAAFIYMHKPKSKYIQWFSILADAIGLSQFISIGIAKATVNGANTIVAFLCAITTALVGGIISSLFSRESIKTVIFSNIAYRLCTIAGTIIYMYWINCGDDQLVAQVKLAIYTLSTSSVCNNIIRIKIKKIILKIIFILQYSFKLSPLNIPYKNIVFISPCFKESFPNQIYNIYKNYDHYKSQNTRREFIFRLHRILQM